MNRMAKCTSLLNALLLSLSSLVSVSYAQSSNTWSSVGQMTQARSGAAAVLLQDGRILISGGTDANGVPTASAEFFNPATGVFSAASAMNVARANHAAIVLSSGDVLVTGGVNDAGGDYTNTAEIFSASTQHWTELQATLPQGVCGHAMALLADGNILIAGGQSTTGPVGTLLLFNANDSSITLVGSLLTARSNASAAATPDGRVLIAGGTDINNNVLSSTEIFIYSSSTLSGTVSAGPALTYPRTAGTATSTYDGVALIGGYNFQNGIQTDLGTAEIFSQWTNALRVVSGATPRSSHFAVLLPNNGGILSMGGTAGQAVDLLQPWTNSRAGAFIAASSTLNNHASGFAVPASLGSLLAAGGQGSAADTAELYWFPTISTDQKDYPPGTPVVMTGTGFQAGETVDLHLHEWVNQTVTDIPDYSVITAGDGTFSFTGYAPTTSDLGARYHLTAIGETSGLQAQTIFTDGNGNLVSGHVYDSVTSSPIAGATVSCTTTSGCNALFSTTTDVNGFYVFDSTTSKLTFGGTSATLTLTASKSGYSSGTVTFSISNGGTASSKDILLTPSQANTTTAVTSTANPSVYGQSTTFTAKVSVVAPGSGTPTGTVTFTVDGQAQTPSSLSGGIATFNTSILSVSATGHTVSAAYNGDANFKNSSGSLTGGQVVNQASTTTGVTSSQNPSVYGQSVTFTATVSANSPGSGTPTGTVTFTVDGVAQAPLALSGGTASFNTSSLSASTTAHTVSAAYNGDTNFQTSAASLTGGQTVNKASTTTGVTSSVNPSVFGQSVTFTATVGIVGPGVGTPAGSVTFTIDGVAQTPTTLSGLTATFTTTSLSVSGSAHSVSAEYNGDSSFQTSTGNLANGQSVNKASTTTDVTSNANPSVYGQSVTLTAAVSVVGPGVGTPTGTVTFTIDGVAQTPTALSGSTATFTTTSLSVSGSAHSVSAEYNGDGNFLTSTGNLTNGQVVNKASITTAVSSSVNPSVYGQSVTFTATLSVVAPGVGTPTGTVTFTVDGIAQSPTAVGGSVATFTTTSLAVSGSPHSVSAAYNGDSNFAASSGSLANGQTVNKADTSTAVATITPEPSVVGQAYMVNVTVAAVSPGTGTPTGTVTIGDGTVNCMATLSSGSGNCSLTSTTAGTKTIGLSYNGDTNFNISTNTGSHTVNPAPTATTITSGLTPDTVVGQQYTIGVSVAAVAPGSGIPTGTVTISDGAASCSATLSSGSGSCSLTSTTAGARTITAAYNTDGNYQTSSTTGSHTVNPAPTATAITSGLTPDTVVGQQYTIAVSVSAVAPGSGIPTGTVTIGDGAASCTATLSNGSGSCSLTSTTAGGKTIMATYNTDGNYLTSSATGSHQVNKASTTTALTSNQNPSVFGQSVTFTATVSVNSPGSGAPTGTVTFTIDGQQTTVAISGNTATYTTSSLSVSGSQHAVSADYNGDSNFLTSAGILAGGQTVNKASTTTGVASSVNPSVYGQSVTFTATVGVVAPGSGIPTGTVTFTIDGQQTVVALSGSTATYTTTSLSVIGSPHSVSAAYNGDNNFLSSSSILANGQTVNQAKTTTTVTSSANPSLLNQTVKFTATVGVVTPGAGTPTGTVTFTIDGVAQTPVSLNGSTATFSTSSLAVSGTGHTISAAYNGDTNFSSSSGNVTGGQIVRYAGVGTTCDGDAGHQILQPIDPIGASVFKSTSTTPAKFRVCDANGVSVGTPGVVSAFQLLAAVNGTVTATIDSTESTTPDSAFRWDPAGQQWIFNINNKSLWGSNKTYYFLITLNDGSTIPFQYGLK